MRRSSRGLRGRRCAMTGGRVGRVDDGERGERELLGRREGRHGGGGEEHVVRHAGKVRARRHVGGERNVRLCGVVKKPEVLLDAVVRRGAENARSHAVVVGTVGVEAALEELLDKIYSRGRGAEIPLRPALTAMCSAEQPCSLRSMTASLLETCLKK